MLFKTYRSERCLYKHFAAQRPFTRPSILQVLSICNHRNKNEVQTNQAYGAVTVSWLIFAAHFLSSWPLVLHSGTRTTVRTLPIVHALDSMSVFARSAAAAGFTHPYALLLLLLRSYRPPKKKFYRAEQAWHFFSTPRFSPTSTAVALGYSCFLWQTMSLYQTNQPYFVEPSYRATVLRRSVTRCISCFPTNSAKHEH